MEKISILEDGLGYSFKNKLLLQEALTHKSFVNENREAGTGDNERLEFLGDAVLDMVVSRMLFDDYPLKKEGELSKLRASLVREESLSGLARGIELGLHLRLGRGEENSGGRDKNSLLADAFEALVAAVYLDGGIAVAEKLIKKLFRPLLKSDDLIVDYKSALQELCQKNGRTTPLYQLIAEEGPDHEKHFEVALSLDGEVLSNGRGRNIKEAEQQAARSAYRCLEDE